MRYLSSLIVAVLIILSAPLASADFFDEQIVGADTETAMLRGIQLNSISLRDTKEMMHYNHVAYFVTSIKDEAVKRFDDGTIPVYRRYDIITALDGFVYDMNQYFIYRKMYEWTKKYEYAENAKTYLEDAKWSYSRLKSALKNSAY